MSELSNLVFFIVGFVTIFCAASVVLVSNPIYSALLLAATMLGISALFFTLDAYFIAAAQLIIYAGAVMVLFVMVVMLFDLKQEKQAFSKGALGFLVKMSSAGFLLGLLLSSIIWVVRQSGSVMEKVPIANGMDATRRIALHLFSKYMLGFELIGMLLLVVLVAAIALAKSKGGTHARS